MDYEEIIGEVLLLAQGTDNVSHTINITQDNICEISAEGDNEGFVSVIQSTSGLGTAYVGQRQATVFIKDANETECGEYFRSTSETFCLLC